MNFAQMLSCQVKPLSAYSADRREESKKRRAKRKRGGLNDGTLSLHEEAVARYRSAWKEGEVWVLAKTVEHRLGLDRSTVLTALRKWHSKYGLLERRPAENRPFNKRRGYEWRWVKPAGGSRESV